MKGGLEDGLGREKKGEREEEEIGKSRGRETLSPTKIIIMNVQNRK